MGWRGISTSMPKNSRNFLSRTNNCINSPLINKNYTSQTNKQTLDKRDAMKKKCFSQTNFLFPTTTTTKKRNKNKFCAKSSFKDFHQFVHVLFRTSKLNIYKERTF